MQKVVFGKTYSLIVMILGIAGIIFSAFRLYYFTVNGDQFRMFVTGGLIIMFTVLTINNYFNLQRLQRNKKKDDTEIV